MTTSVSAWERNCIAAVARWLEFWRELAGWLDNGSYEGLNQAHRNGLTELAKAQSDVGASTQCQKHAGPAESQLPGSSQ